jgi:hypothetical protein
VDITKVKVSGRLALACGGCGEIILFLGRERDWYEPGSDGRPKSFLCSGCGQQLTLANRVVEVPRTVRNLGGWHARHHFVRRRESVVDILPEVAPISRYEPVYTLYATLLPLDRLSKDRGEVSEDLGISVPGGSFIFHVCRRDKRRGRGCPPFVRPLPECLTP